jgi:hypothetical protein
MGISRFPIRPGVDLRNINSASPRGPFFLQPATWLCQYPIKSTLLPRFIAREATRLAILVRMHPLVRRDFARFRQLDHAHRRCVAALSTGPAF